MGRGLKDDQFQIWKKEEVFEGSISNKRIFAPEICGKFCQGSTANIGRNS
jgi:hypothetical protein